MHCTCTSLRTRGIWRNKDKKRGGKSRCSAKSFNFEVYRADRKEGTSGGWESGENSHNGGGSVEKDRNSE